MMLVDALAELSTGLDALYHTTQGRLLTRLTRAESRLSFCEESLRLAVLKNGELHKQNHLRIEKLQQDLDGETTHNKKLQQRMSKEKQERNEEKEWIAALWPDAVAKPTILQQYEPPTAIKFVSQVEVWEERRRLLALVSRRAAKEQVLQHIEVATQWKLIVVPPSRTDEGEYTPGQTFYQNAATLETSWEPPVAMFYEPPSHWDRIKMDWKDSYSLENFYPREETEVGDGGEDEPSESTPLAGRASHNNQSRHKIDEDSTVDGNSDDDEPSTQRGSRGGDDEDEDGDDDDHESSKPLDPTQLRSELEGAFSRVSQLREQLDKTLAEQRALALQLLNATRESFEREKEEIDQEDDAVKKVEREKRKEKQREEAAARASAAAQERKALGTKFSKDSVTKQDLTLSKDDELFEKELEAFAVAQRADRLYLAAPLARDTRVRTRRQLDDEFVHMKHVEQRTLAIEKSEYDLLEKTSLRVEEATTLCERLRDQLADARCTQMEVAEELKLLPSKIEALEVAQPPPIELRPTAEQLAQARERFVEVEESPSVDGSDIKDGEDGDDKEEEDDDDDEEDDEGGDKAQAVDAATLARDEVELRKLKAYVDAEKQWHGWEQSEVLRLEDLAAAYDRFKELESTARRVHVDIALYESDVGFFERLLTREKETNDVLWKIQANSQVERARFLVERAAREESVFQVQDEYEAVRLRLEEAQRLPRQATNPLEKLELIDESKRLAEQLQRQLSALQTRFDKENDAKTLLMALELRFCEYIESKLQEETALFKEKQALWDANTTLHEELVVQRDKIEELYVILQQSSAATAREQYAQATSALEEKLRRVESLRQFLLLCYEREARWRSLATIALIKDTTSEQWMTAAQRERQESELALAAKQHGRQLAGLHKEIGVLKKVIDKLKLTIDEKEAMVARVRSEYQRVSEEVRVETQQIVSGLKEKLIAEQRERETERQQLKEERARMIKQHDRFTQELVARLERLEAENEQQWHWLTAAKRELHAQRVANDELLMGYTSLEKRRATETNDMRFRISSQIGKINNIEMWNLSLKIQAREAHSERISMQKEMAALVDKHKQQQRVLRLENWKHRVTAQAILTNVDALFLFFAQGLGILAGATPQANDALRENGGVEILALLAMHSSQDAIRIIAAKALGQITWNANVTQRSLGWKAKKQWFEWQEQQSARIMKQLASQQLAFDSVASEDSSAINWLADTADQGGAGESDAELRDKRSKKIAFLKRWNARDDIEHPNVNRPNQEYLGLAPRVLQTIIDLCKPPQDATDTAVRIQRNALRSLALVAMDTRNTAIVGRLDGCIALLVRLLQPSETDAPVRRHATHALANLAFQNAHNQRQILHAGAIPQLLAYCTKEDDVDLLFASVLALLHLSYDNTQCCEAIFDHGGLAVLTRLCHSPRIHDAIDLEAFESIQTGASEIIANVITQLDSVDATSQGDPLDPDQTPSEGVERDIVAAILAATDSSDSEGVGIHTFVLMCASCTRDVAFHGALVLGSVAQHDAVRAAIGSAGGIDALFLLANQRWDPPLVAMAVWALANATWNRENQYRIARHLAALYQLCVFSSDDNNQQESDEQIRANGLCVLANMLFYNDANRQLVAADADWLALLEFQVRQLPTSPTLEHAARALCSLAYSDAVALALGGASGPEALAPARAVNGLELFLRLCGHVANPMVQRHGLYGVINMCLHDSNKAKILEIPRGVETLVNLSGSTNRELCEPALEALDLLADVRSAKLATVGSHPSAVLSPSTMSSLAASDLKKLIAMLQDATGSPALVAMASDAIADEVWKKPSAKVRLRNEHGLDTLLELCVSDASPIAGHDKPLLSCLWALRNSVADNVRNQDYVAALRGLPQLIALGLRRRRSDDIVEAVLAVLVALVAKHPLNSQELVQCGLDLLLTLADGDDTAALVLDEDSEEARRQQQQPSLSPQSKRSIAALKQQPTSKENRALARELLHLVAPYNSTSLPSLPAAKASSPDKQRVLKKPLAASVHLPPVQPTAASTTSPKRSSNN